MDTMASSTDSRTAPTVAPSSIAGAGESLRVMHARKQGAADGFQDGWHAALQRIREGDSVDDLSELVPDPPMLVALRHSEARIYPDVNYEKYLDELTVSAVDAVNDAADESDEHLAALLRQTTEAITALRQSRDELRRDIERIGLAAPQEPKDEQVPERSERS